MLKHNLRRIPNRTGHSTASKLQTSDDMPIFASPLPGRSQHRFSIDGVVPDCSVLFFSAVFFARPVMELRV